MNGLWTEDEEKANLLFLLFYGINFAIVLVRWLYCALLSCSMGAWGSSEFLINFQGGYVRRGLMGEILHYFCEKTGYLPNYIVIPLSLCCFAGFCLLLYCIIKKLKFCWLVLLTNYGIFGADLLRKDYMVFLLLIASLWLYPHIKKRFLLFFTPILILIIMLHIHEASFFYCIPVYFLILFSDKDSGLPFLEKIGQVVFITITMGVLCIYKGDQTISDAIVNSWQIVYPETYHKLYSGSIAAIGWDSWSAFLNHIKSNFVKGTIPYSGYVLRPIALMVIFFIMVRIGLRRHIKNNIFLVDQFICISLILFLTLIPMFTVLSCDFRRVVSYWVISSIIALYYLQNGRIFLMNLSVAQKGVAYVRNLILKPCVGKTPYFLLLIFGIPYMDNELIQYGPPSLSFIIRAVGRFVEALA